MKKDSTQNLQFDLEIEENLALEAIRGLNLPDPAVGKPFSLSNKTGVKRTSTSLEFNPSVSQEEWEACGQDLKQAARGVSWYIGDWLNFGKEHFSNRYDQMLTATGLKKQQLQNIAWVAGKFEPYRRHADLSFRHHELVAALQEKNQDIFLALAEANKWKTARLRLEIEKWKATGKIGPSFVGDPLTPPFRCLLFEPINEQGVVFLFALMAKDLGFLVEGVQSGYPDCIAKRKVKPGKWQAVRIEFEFESRNFNIHKHDVNNCDIIVCWHDNWHSCPKSLEVIALDASLKALSDADSAKQS